MTNCATQTGGRPATGAGARQAGPADREGLGLYEELVESRVRAVRVMGSEAQFDGAGQFQPSRARTMVDQRNAADLHVVLR
jgi:hypothetical protein